MKYAVLFLIVGVLGVSTSFTTHPKIDLVGLWQENDTVIGAGFKATFRFYGNDDYRYDCNSYEELNPLLNIYGKYKLNDSTLSISVVSWNALDNYGIIAASPGFQSGQFVTYGNKVKTYFQPDSLTASERHTFQVCQNMGKRNCIVIDNTKYYRISNNPDGEWYDK